MPQSLGRDAQSSIFRAGASGIRPRVPASWAALEASARRAMSREAWAYVAGSAGRETTAEANHAAFDRVSIVPRVLRDVAERDLSVEIFGRTYPAPIVLQPVGVLGIVHRDADLAVARAAAGAGLPFVYSNQASVPMESVAEVGGPHWFQLYWSTSDDLVASLVSRAEASAAEAIVVTLDTHVLGWRPRDLDLGYLPFVHGQGIAQYTSDPVFRSLVAERMRQPRTGERPRVTPTAVRTLLEMTRRYPGPAAEARAAVETFVDVFSRSSLTWADLAFLRDRTSLPIVLKGIQHPDDARLAIDHGVDGIVVSNHAGRQLDGAIGSLDALPAVVEAVEGRIPVILDSGVRGGSDIVKALALGATAVGIGRAYAYGLAVAGEAGVAEVLRNLVAELDLSLAVSGRASIRDLSAADLSPLPVSPGSRA